MNVSPLEQKFINRKITIKKLFIHSLEDILDFFVRFGKCIRKNFSSYFKMSEKSSRYDAEFHSHIFFQFDSEFVVVVRGEVVHSFDI